MQLTCVVLFWHNNTILWPKKPTLALLLCVILVKIHSTMITLGIDIGSSSIKVSLFDVLNGKSIASVSYPPYEMQIVSVHAGWAEQDPDTWMQNMVHAIAGLKRDYAAALQQVQAIGITYQMHGLVLVNQLGHVLRPAIIWCDSRAVSIGQKAFNDLSHEFCLGHLLNSPGNFTASKLSWVKQHEPEAYQKVYKFMLPGDYIAFKLTNQLVTTASGLSEGVFWDFERQSISKELMMYYGFDEKLVPDLVETFSIQGRLTPEMASQLGMSEGIPVTYRAGDQPNNAFSLNVLKPGEVAATAGTSGVIYGVTDVSKHDPLSRVNTFLHVNNKQTNPRLGILFCLNSVGILNAWARQHLLPADISYDAMNELAATIAEGSDGLFVMPFGNGAERMLGNKNPGASIHNLDLLKHGKGHLLRALQESIAYAFMYGIELMQPLGLNLSVIRAGKANLFLSPVFTQTLSNLSGAQIELYDTNGAEGAARGAAIGAGFYANAHDAFTNFAIFNRIEPQSTSQIQEHYEQWKQLLEQLIKLK